MNEPMKKSRTVCNSSCPLNKKRVGSAGRREVQAGRKSTQMTGAFSIKKNDSYLHMGDRMNLLFSIALAQKVKTRKAVTNETNRLSDPLWSSYERNTRSWLRDQKNP